MVQIVSVIPSEMMRIKNDGEVAGWRGGYVLKEVGGANVCLRRGGSVCAILALPCGCFPRNITREQFRWPVAVR